MVYKKDLQGMKFGRLTVLRFAGNNKHHRATWICQCDCGKITDPISSNSLKSGNTQSCGCLYVEAHKTHGKSSTRLYSIWNGMKARCYRKSHKHYKSYGGRGITICDEWRNDFKAFYDWAMLNGYSEELTIDRIDPSGNYEPSNCRWETHKKQQRNKRNVHSVEINGISKPISEWAEHTGIKYQTIIRRYYAGVRGSDLIKAVKK